jgi:hypothetical protein
MFTWFSYFRDKKLSVWQPCALPCESLRKIAKAWQFNPIGRLQEALAPEINFNQYIGEVNYIDYKKSTFRLTIYFFLFYSNVFNTKVKYAS